MSLGFVVEGALDGILADRGERHSFMLISFTVLLFYAGRFDSWQGLLKHHSCDGSGVCFVSISKGNARI